MIENVNWNFIEIKNVALTVHCVGLSFVGNGINFLNNSNENNF